MESPPRASRSWLMGVEITLLRGAPAAWLGTALSALVPRRPSTMIAVTFLAWAVAWAGHQAIMSSEATRLALLLASPLPHEVLRAAMIGMLLVGPVLIWHELGHLAYVHSRGIGPASIGLTSYVLLPALYTRVRCLGALSRTEQATFFLAGIYFQSLLAIGLTGYMLVDPVTGSDLFVLNAAVCGLNLLPLFRLDGYQAAAILIDGRRRLLWLLNAASLGLTTLLLAMALTRIVLGSSNLIATGGYRLSGGTGLLVLNALLLSSLLVALARRLKVALDRPAVRDLRPQRLG